MRIFLYRPHDLPGMAKTAIIKEDGEVLAKWDSMSLDCARQQAEHYSSQGYTTLIGPNALKAVGIEYDENNH